METIRTNVGDAKKIAKKLDPAARVHCVIDGSVKGLSMNKHTTAGRVVELLDTFDNKYALTFAIAPI